jgi:hypothetical protein
VHLLKNPLNGLAGSPFSKNRSNPMIVAAFYLILASLLFTLGVFEISFPDIFSWAEVGWVAKQFPKAWKYTLHIGLVEVFIASLLIIPAWKADRKFTAKGLETLIRLGLGGMFIGASLFKIADPKSFASLVAQYQFLPEFSINFFGLLMPQLELWFGIALIVTPYTRECGLAILAMFFAFIAALTWALYHDLGITCGCFQLEGAQDKAEAWISLIRDLILLVPNIWLVTRPNKSLIALWRD